MFDLRVPQQNGSPSSCNGHRLNHEVPLPVKGLIHILQRLQWIHQDRHGIWHFATTPMTLPPMGPMGPMGPVAERHAESTSPKLLAQAKRIISLSCQPQVWSGYAWSTYNGHAESGAMLGSPLWVQRSNAAVPNQIDWWHKASAVATCLWYTSWPQFIPSSSVRKALQEVYT